jgi:hypothetical protein
MEGAVMETIDLDCPPGEPRPGDLIGMVLAGTGLAAGETVGRFFGNWTWEFDVSREEWETRIQPIIKPRIVALYEAGIVRYASW